MAAGDTTPRVAEQRRAPAGKLSYEEFLDWCDEDTLAEWVRGEVHVTSPASLRHQDLMRFLLIVLHFWVRSRDLGVVIAPPFQMRLPAPINTGREPDILFVARIHLDRLRQTYLDGPADLVVEIVSPESIGRDRGQKFVEYEAAGIPEYWLIDPERRQVEFYQLGTDGRYRAAVVGATGTYESRVLEGLRLPVEWLWQDPLPDETEALRSLGLLG
jgi:Uma2 family endonuclease